MGVLEWQAPVRDRPQGTGEHFDILKCLFEILDRSPTIQKTLFSADPTQDVAPKAHLGSVPGLALAGVVRQIRRCPFSPNRLVLH
jgi:hypothetical protein